MTETTTTHKRICLSPGASLDDRFWIKVYAPSDDGCWEWLASVTGKAGYGKFWDDTRLVPAHRFAYERLVGTIPAGLDLDHLCRNRRCVNPDHLEPVTRRENSLRGQSPFVLAHIAGHCLRDHELTPENTYTEPNGHRHCRICRAESWRRFAPTRVRRR